MKTKLQKKKFRYLKNTTVFKLYYSISLDHPRGYNVSRNCVLLYAGRRRQCQKWLRTRSRTGRKKNVLYFSQLWKKKITSNALESRNNAARSRLQKRIKRKWIPAYNYRGIVDLRCINSVNSSFFLSFFCSLLVRSFCTVYKSGSTGPGADGDHTTSQRTT